MQLPIHRFPTKHVLRTVKESSMISEEEKINNITICCEEIRELGGCKVDSPMLS